MLSTVRECDMLKYLSLHSVVSKSISEGVINTLSRKKLKLEKFRKQLTELLNIIG